MKLGDRRQLASETLPGGLWQQTRVHCPDAAGLGPGQSLCIAGEPVAIMSRDSQGNLSLVHRRERPLDLDGDWTLEDAPAALEPGPRLLVAEDSGLFASVFWVAELRRRTDTSVLALLGATGVFPFSPSPSRIYLPDMPAPVIATMPLFDDWQIPARLAHADGLPGCYDGPVLALAETWLSALATPARSRLQLVLLGSASWLDEARARLTGLACAGLTAQRSG